MISLRYSTRPNTKGDLWRQVVTNIP